jgi:hypothetical protein
VPNPPPPIDPRYVGDDTALGAVIDVLIREDPRMQRHVLEILHRQRQLQEASAEAGWEAYLHLEIEVNARYHDALLRVARWGWGQGREHERKRRAEP